jgi:hypothetical protein
MMLKGEWLGLFLSITMVAIVALIWGGIKLVRGNDDRKRGWLMLTAALVLFGNVLIWAWPI